MKQIRDLIEYLNARTAEYDAGNPTISDKEWDNYYFELETLERETGLVYPDSPTQTINYEVVNALKKVPHEIPMLSLDKTKDWQEFLNYFSGKDAVGMLKLDGLSCRLQYTDGVLVEASTRGTGGIIGEDILHNAKVVSSIPKEINYKEPLVIDGEIICDITTFNENFADNYANPRNFAAGSIRLLDSKECKNRHLTFVAWNVITGFEETNSFIDKLVKLDKLGFITTPWTSSFDFDAKEFLVDKAKELGYPIDGLVGRFDDIAYGISLGSTGHHPRSAYAFKFYDEEYETVLENIDWTMGRTGELTPIAVFDPIDDGESVIERASLHNVTVMHDQLYIPYKGEHIWVYKANQIIPQISKKKWIANDYDPEINMFKIPSVCPICGEATEIRTSDSGVQTLYCSNEGCLGKLVNRLDHLCGKKGFDIKGLSVATLEKLCDWGWISALPDVFNLKEYRAEWVKKPGFGAKSVDNILTAIEQAKNNWQTDKFIAALGIPLVGSTIAKDICKKVKNFEDFRNKVDQNFTFSNWEGFGMEIESAILRFDYSEADKIYAILGQEENEYAASSNQKSSITGKTFVVTGKLSIYKNRDMLKKEIEKFGGKVVDSVSKNTSYLINNDINSTSSKNASAKKIGIPIITEKDFVDMIK